MGAGPGRSASYSRHAETLERPEILSEHQGGASARGRVETPGRTRHRSTGVPSPVLPSPARIRRRKFPDGLASAL